MHIIFSVHLTGHDQVCENRPRSNTKNESLRLLTLCLLLAFQNFLENHEESSKLTQNALEQKNIYLLCVGMLISIYVLIAVLCVFLLECLFISLQKTNIQQYLELSSCHFLSLSVI